MHRIQGCGQGELKRIPQPTSMIAAYSTEHICKRNYRWKA